MARQVVYKEKILVRVAEGVRDELTRVALANGMSRADMIRQMFRKVIARGKP